MRQAVVELASCRLAPTWIRCNCSCGRCCSRLQRLGRVHAPMLASPSDLAGCPGSPCPSPHTAGAYSDGLPRWHAAEHLLCTGLRLMPRAIADPTVKLVRTRVPVWCGAFGLTRGADCLREERLVSARWFSSAPAARLARNCNAKCAAGHGCRAFDAALPAGCISARYAPVYASIRALFNAPRS